MTPTAEALHCFVPHTPTRAPTSVGALTSVKVAVKDLFDVAGHTSSFGHRQWRATHQPAVTDSEVVARLRAAGASIVGLAKMDQLAYSLIGNVGEGEPPTNTFDPQCFCGGSSSGSASAVAGGVADLGVGTDTAGSIRVPAAACGLFSIRPTYGRISTEGAVPLARSLDVVGLLARAPTLLEAALTATSPGATKPVGLRRVLVPAELASRNEPETWMVLNVVAKLAAQEFECRVEEVEASLLVSAAVGDLFGRIQGREIWSEHAEWIMANMTYLASDVQTRLRRCEVLSHDASDVVEADRDAREAYCQRLRALLDEGALMLLPVVPRRGPDRGWTEEQLLGYRLECFRLAAPSSLAGIPQVVVPARGRARTVPLGFLGPSGSDEALLDLSRRLATTVLGLCEQSWV